MEAARAMAQGIENADHDAEVRCLPMADGGEGTARALVDATGGSMHAVPVHDPLGRPVEGHFGLLADGTTAVVETAEASGLALLEAKERNPLIASSYGTGELMLAAVRSGAKRIIVGLGGSATNDAGAGLLQALGVRLLDGNGNDLAHGGAALADLAAIDISTMDPALKNVAITAACDVTNPLTGPTGASAVFGPQKGASKDDVATLDAALAHFAQGIDSQLGVAVNDVPGAGAAGGIGAALKGFLNAEFRPGIAIVIEQSGLDAAAQWADVVFTGEGSIDFQTKFGKTPAGVAETAKRHGKPVIAVYNYKHSLSRIQERFSDKVRVRVYQDAKDKEEWNAGKIDLLLIHPKACKYGLNLQQGGSTLVWFDLTWSLDDYLQTNARVWRQGQKDTVVIHHIVSAATIDEKVIKAIQDKDETQNALLRAVRAEIKDVKMNGD